MLSLPYFTTFIHKVFCLFCELLLTRKQSWIQKYPIILLHYAKICSPHFPATKSKAFSNCMKFEEFKLLLTVANSIFHIIFLQKKKIIMNIQLTTNEKRPIDWRSMVSIGTCCNKRSHMRAHLFHTLELGLPDVPAWWCRAKRCLLKKHNMTAWLCCYLDNSLNVCKSLWFGR